MADWQSVLGGTLGQQSRSRARGQDEMTSMDLSEAMKLRVNLGLRKMYYPQSNMAEIEATRGVSALLLPDDESFVWIPPP